MHWKSMQLHTDPEKRNLMRNIARDVQESANKVVTVVYVCVCSGFVTHIFPCRPNS